MSVAYDVEEVNNYGRNNELVDTTMAGAMPVYDDIIPVHNEFH